MSKGLRNAENMDHEDAPYFVAPASYTEIDMITGSPGGGEKKFFTPEGYASAYCGFSQYLISIVNSKELLRNEEKRQQSLKDAIKSFVWYDATLDNRFRKFEGAKKARLSEHHFNKSPTADNSCKLSLHRDQLRNLIREIGKEYGMSFEYLFEKTGPTTNAQEAERQKVVETNIENFTNVVDQLFQRDSGEGITRVITRLRQNDPKSGQGLRGMRGWTLRRDQARVATPEGARHAQQMGLL